MDRNLHPKYIPQCPRNIGLPDQYMWEQKDTNSYMCYNGISNPIYDCRGWINFSLPLDKFPPASGISPQIPLVKRSHLNYRGNPSMMMVQEGYVPLATSYTMHKSHPSPASDPWAWYHPSSDMRENFELGEYSMPDLYCNHRTSSGTCGSCM